MAGSGTLKLRARYPDGSVHTLVDVPRTTTYKALLEQLGNVRNAEYGVPEKVLRAGPPPITIEQGDETEIGTFLRSGDCLIVEPEGRVEGKAKGRGRKRGRKSMVEKAEEKLKKRAKVEENKGKARGKKKTGIVGIRDITAKGKGRQRRSEIGEIFKGLDVEEEDDGDGDWREDDESVDEDGDVHFVGAVKKGKKVGTSASGAGSERGARASGTGKRKAAISAGKRMKAVDAEEGGNVDSKGAVDLLDIGAQKAQLGVAIAQSMLEKENGKFTKSLQEALKVRQEAAAGERRYAAMLGGWYKFENMFEGRAFRVECQELGAGKWEKDMDGKVFGVYSKDVLQAGILEVVNAGEEIKERLRVHEMAKYSPGMFWNMVREYGKKVEDGLRELAPDVDWGFLANRRREISKRAKESLKNKEVMDSIDREDEEWQ